MDKSTGEQAANTMAACLVCGNQFDNDRRGKRGRKPKYCSRQCRSRAYSERNSGTIQKRAQEYYRRNREVKRQNARAAYYNHDALIKCESCGKWFGVNSRRVKDPKYCSQNCCGKSKNTQVEKSCTRCGETFWLAKSHVNRGHGKYCSNECRFPNPGQGRARYKLVRRQRLKQVKTDNIDRTVLFESYNWHCAMCGCKTPKVKRGTTARNAPEMDHIIPIAAGGADTWAKVQLLCRRCNQQKGKKIIGQLSLA